MQQNYCVIAVAVLLLTFVDVSAQADEPYIPTREGQPDCVAPKIDRLYTSDPAILDKIRKRALDQGRFGLCFGFSGFFVIQYNELAQTGKELALPDVLFRGCRKDAAKLLEGGGLPRVFLQNLKHRNVALETEKYPFDYDKMFSQLSQVAPSQCYQTAEALTTSLKDSVRWNEELNDYCDQLSEGKVTSKKPERFTFKVFSNFPGIEKTELHPYQVAFNEAESKDQMIRFMEEHFKSASKEPVVLSFCANVNRDGSCHGESGHAVVVSGVRRLICQSQMQLEWRVENSYGPGAEAKGQQGWLRAQPLAGATVNFKGGVTRAYPCKKPGATSDLPECRDHVLGPLPLHYLVRDEDVKGVLRYLDHHPDAHADYDSQGLTPLFLPFLGKGKPNATIVEALMRVGADPNAKSKTNSRFSVWQAAAMNPNLDIILFRSLNRKPPKNFSKLEALAKTQDVKNLFAFERIKQEEEKHERELRPEGRDERWLQLEYFLAQKYLKGHSGTVSRQFKSAHPREYGIAEILNATMSSDTARVIEIYANPSMQLLRFNLRVALKLTTSEPDLENETEKRIQALTELTQNLQWYPKDDPTIDKSIRSDLARDFKGTLYAAIKGISDEQLAEIVGLTNDPVFKKERAIRIRLMKKLPVVNPF